MVVVLVMVIWHAPEIPVMLVMKVGEDNSKFYSIIWSSSLIVSHHVHTFVSCHLSCSVGTLACASNTGSIAEGAW